MILNENFKREFGCVLVNYNFPDLEVLQDSIDKEDIYDELDYGLEVYPHVTLLFGLHDEVSENQVTEKLKGLSFDECTLGFVSYFEGDKFEVLKFKAFNKNFKEANKYLSELPHTLNFPHYDAHMTIAYLKPGRSQEYVDLFKGFSVIVKEENIQYSLSNGKNIIL